ncbi:MAG: tyrosine--tRNA ligase, partial [Candidatus Uhrbacteria bacterium]|nr:tyrosine--tRNA ligase [Candidatus Uhrbacteria bacterium]
MAVSTDSKKIEELLTRGVEKIFPSREFLEARLKEGKQLSLYLGIDPTGPDLHIGHSIQLRKLRQFQDLGHKVILLIGDFTGMIGDPTDKSATRVRLTREQVLANAEKYKEQASKILDFGGKNPVELRYNSEWHAKLSLTEVLELAAHFTVPQMLARDMFKKRMQEGKDVYMHEFLYPLMQGYDSVAMDVDGEVGGNDQTFNMLAGRDLMKAMQGKEKFVIAGKLLADPTGKKMGKSEGNMITLGDSSDDMFGKIMSWTDGM